MNILVGVIADAPVWVMPSRYVDQLRHDFPQHTFLDAWTRQAIRDLLPQADAAFTPFVDRDVFQTATRLKWVQVAAVGVGGLLYPEMVASPIVITNARGIRARPMAEHIVGVSIALARQLHTAVRRQVAHEWAQTELEGGGAIHTLEGRTMGIVGLGAIGRETARLASALGMRVIATRRSAGRSNASGERIAGVDRVLPPEALDELLAGSDLIVLAVPLTPATRGLIGPREIALMKPGAYIVNIGRGKVIDDDALLAALEQKRIGGAALDVFPHEPLDPASPYWDLPNVIVTPHTSGAMEYWEPLVALFSENLRRFDAGEPLLNAIDKHAGY